MEIKKTGYHAQVELIDNGKSLGKFATEKLAKEFVAKTKVESKPEKKSDAPDSKTARKTSGPGKKNK